VPFIASLSEPLPEDVVGPPGEARAARANISRLAVWTLLHHTRRHPAVTAALAQAAGALAPFIAEADARGGAQAPYDATRLRHRLEVLPALLHLSARAALDNHAGAASEQPA